MYIYIQKGEIRLPTNRLPTALFAYIAFAENFMRKQFRLRIKIIAYSSIAYMHFYLRTSKNFRNEAHLPTCIIAYSLITYI